MNGWMNNRQIVNIHIVWNNTVRLEIIWSRIILITQAYVHMNIKKEYSSTCMLATRLCPIVTDKLLKYKFSFVMRMVFKKFLILPKIAKSIQASCFLSGSNVESFYTMKHFYIVSILAYFYIELNFYKSMFDDWTDCFNWTFLPRTQWSITCCGHLLRNWEPCHKEWRP